METTTTTTPVPAPATPATPSLVSTAETDMKGDVQKAETEVKADVTKVRTDLASAESVAKAEGSAGLSWMQKHERIVLTALVLLAGSWFGDHWLNVTAAHDKQQAEIAVQQLDEQKTKDTQLAQQVTTLSTQYQTVVTQLTQENAKLATQVHDRVTVLHDQVQTDQSLPLPDLGGRWAQLANIAPADISASTAGITVTDTGARETVSQLEQIPVLQANLKDTETIADNKQDELTKANTVVSAQTTQIAGLNTTITDEEKSCKADIASVKATARRGKFKSFLYGVGVGAGAVLGIIIDHKF